MNIALETLDLSDTDLKIEAVIALATVLRNNRTLKFLRLNRPLLFTNQEEPTVHFAKMLKVRYEVCNVLNTAVWSIFTTTTTYNIQVNTTLQGLSLMKYDMRDFGVGQIAENILDNTTLTHLDLSWYTVYNCLPVS